MANVFVEYLEDSFDCDDCGLSYEEGAIVYIDGEEVFKVDPVAHCYNTVGVSYNEVRMWVLRRLGLAFVSDIPMTEEYFKDLLIENGHGYVSHYEEHEYPSFCLEEDDDEYPEGYLAI